MDLDLDLAQLIALLESDVTTDPIDRVAAAAALKDQMEHLGDELLDHFVKEARDSGCSWNQIGEALGVTRQAAQQRHGSGPLARIVEGLRAGRFQRFTPRARAVVVAAQTEARDRGHDRVGTEHVLLALYTAAPGNLGAAALGRLDVSQEAVTAAIDAAHPPTDRRVRGHIRFGPDAKSGLEGALRAALELEHNYIGCEHLLIGVAGVDGGLASTVLADQGATPDRIFPVIETLVREAPGN